MSVVLERSRSKRLLAGAALLAGLAPALLSGAAAAQDRTMAEPPGESDMGRALAMRRCAGCHMVHGGQRQVSDTGPSFLEIARKGGELDWMEGFLADPHPPMPDMSLSRQEIRDLRACFNSLRN